MMRVSRAVIPDKATTAAGVGGPRSDLAQHAASWRRIRPGQPQPRLRLLAQQAAAAATMAGEQAWPQVGGAGRVRGSRHGGKLALGGHDADFSQCGFQFTHSMALSLEV